MPTHMVWALGPRYMSTRKKEKPGAEPYGTAPLFCPPLVSFARFPLPSPRVRPRRLHPPCRLAPLLLSSSSTFPSSLRRFRRSSLPSSSSPLLVSLFLRVIFALLLRVVAVLPLHLCSRPPLLVPSFLRVVCALLLLVSPLR